jgi:hypothetical protein
MPYAVSGLAADAHVEPVRITEQRIILEEGLIEDLCASV